MTKRADNPIIESLSSAYAAVRVHGNSQVAPDGMFIVTFRPDEDVPEAQRKSALEVLDHAMDVESFRGLTLAASSCPGSDSSLILFHQGTQDTNSKLPYLHMHVVSGTLSESFKHVQEQKTYVPHPNKMITDHIQKHVAARSLNHLDFSGNNGCGEAAYHHILVHTGYANLREFAEKAGHNEMWNFRQRLVELMKPDREDLASMPFSSAGREVTDTRIVIDEKFNPTGFFTVHIIGGENLGQNGQKHRWFEAAPTPSV